MTRRRLPRSRRSGASSSSARPSSSGTLIASGRPSLSMKPSELPRHLWPACRRVMLRQAAAMARDLLDHADDLQLEVSRARVEHIERSALHELAAAGDTIAD